MTLKALVEILLHVDTFRNIDLFYQGLYFAKFRVYYRRNKNPSQKLDQHKEELLQYESMMEIVQPYWSFCSQR